MKLKELTTINQLADFLSGAQAVAFTVADNKDACYRWIQGELAKFSYMKLSKSDKGIVIQYLMKISGYSRQQITRLIKQYKMHGRLQRRQRTVAGFKTKYTEHDIGLLAEMDKRHETPCGHVIKKLCERAYRSMVTLRKGQAGRYTRTIQNGDQSELSHFLCSRFSNSRLDADYNDSLRALGS